jgi:hypothetical protein
VYRPVLILPVSYLDELKALPEHQLSFAAYTTHRHYGQVQAPDPFVIKSIKNDLTQNIVRALAALQDECEYAFATEMPDCPSDTWTPVHVYPMLCRMIALLSGRVFVGLPLCRDQNWINLTINATIDCFAGVKKLDLYSNFWRPFAKLYVPEVQGLNRNLAEARRMLKPILEQRLKDMKSKHFESPNDLMDVSNLLIFGCSHFTNRPSSRYLIC